MVRRVAHRSLSLSFTSQDVLRNVTYASERARAAPRLYMSRSTTTTRVRAGQDPRGTRGRAPSPRLPSAASRVPTSASLCTTTLRSEATSARRRALARASTISSVAPDFTQPYGNSSRRAHYRLPLFVRCFPAAPQCVAPSASCGNLMELFRPRYRCWRRHRSSQR